MAWVRCCGGTKSRIINVYKDGNLSKTMTVYGYKPSIQGSIDLSGGYMSMTNTGSVLRFSTSNQLIGRSAISEAIDITNTSNLKFTLSVNDSTNMGGYLGIIAENNVTNDYTLLSYVAFNGSGTFNVDTTGRNGRFRVAMFFNSGMGSTKNFDFSEISFS